MYRNTFYTRGLMTVFSAFGSKPLAIWDTHCRDGNIVKFIDQDIKSLVYEISGINVTTTYIVCPKGKKVLGISLPFLVMIVKNLKKYFSFEVIILDHTRVRRRFRVSNFQSTTIVTPLCTVMPIGLSEGWNQIQFNLAEFTRRAYKTEYIEAQNVKVNCNIRLRLIYFTGRLMTDEELPAQYKLFFPVASKVGKLGRSTDAKEREIIPERKKSSNFGMALAASIHSYKKAQEITESVHDASRQVLDEQKQEANQIAIRGAPVEEDDAVLQQYSDKDTETTPDEFVVEDTYDDIPAANTEKIIKSVESQTLADNVEEQPQIVADGQPEDVKATEKEIPGQTIEGNITGETVEVTEREMPVETTEVMTGEAVEGQTYVDDTKDQSIERIGSSIAKKSSTTVAATIQEVDSIVVPAVAPGTPLSTIHEENEITETQEETPLSE